MTKNQPTAEIVKFQIVDLLFITRSLVSKKVDRKVDERVNSRAF